MTGAPSPADDLRRLKARSDEAWVARARWDPLLAEIHRYVLPWLKVGPNPASTDGLLDSTAVHSAVRFGSRLHNDVLPPGTVFFDLAAGPLVQDENEVARLNAGLQQVTRIIMAVLHGSNFELASSEMCMALAQGTAAMLGVETGDARILAWQTVPIQEIALSEGPFGDVEHVYWKRKWRIEDAMRLFRVNRLPPQLAVAFDNPERRREFLEFRQDTEWDADKQAWRYTAYTALDPDQPIVQRTFKRSRWITPRFLKMPGEVMGRGPAMLALPNAKTLNKTMELVLKSAALGLFGVYLWRDDSVFDPRAAVMKPGALWKVASTGGNGMFGRPIEPLDVGRNFDISNIVLSDQREQTRLALFDGALPDLKDSVRSPTELIERLRRSYRDQAGATGRLVRELITPVVQLVIDVLEERGMLPTKINIDQLGVKLQLTSPLARAQALESVQRVLEGMQIAAQIAPEQAKVVVNHDALLPDVLRALGWSEKHIRSPAERQKLMKMVTDLAGQQMASEQAQSAPPPRPALSMVA